MRMRQADLRSAIGVSAHTLRKIESGSESVDLRAFMLVLWRLGLTDTVFCSLEGIEQSSLVTRYADEGASIDSLASKRVRLPKPKPEAF